MSNAPLDCVIVGYNDVDLGMVLDTMQPMTGVSGALRNMAHNTVRYRGARMAYMTLLNAALEEVTGREHHLHVMQLPNLGAAYLASFLVRRQLSVEIVNLFNQETDRLAALLQRGPRAVAITTTFYVEAEPIRQIVQFIRARRPETIVIVGGPHIFNICNDQDVATQDYYFNMLGADIYIHDAQGENTLFNVLETLRLGETRDLGRIDNAIVHRRVWNEPGRERSPAAPRLLPMAHDAPTASEGSFIRTPRTPEQNGLDENVIDWSVFPLSYYTPTVQMRTARSCAFQCAFCSYPVMAGPLTLTSLDAVEREMHQLHHDGVRQLVFIDDTFNVPLPRYKNVLRMMIRNRFDFQWVSYFRCSNSDDECFDLMKESGCQGVFLGIESGDQDMLVRMNKHAALDKYAHGIQQLNARDILTFASLIVGFPGETRQSVLNTIAFINRTQPTLFRAEVYYHSTHLPIQKQAAQYGIRGGGYSWRHDSMDWREACELVDEVYRLVRGPIILPEHMFDFWSIPYLLGRGISKRSVIDFVRAAHPLLVEGLTNEELPKGMEARLYAGIHAATSRIAEDMARQQAIDAAPV